MSTPRRPVLLVIRDGWGKNPDPAQDKCNAVVQAKKACDDRLHAKCPVTLVKASGLDVGLPDVRGACAAVWGRFGHRSGRNRGNGRSSATRDGSSERSIDRPGGSPFVRKGDLVPCEIPQVDRIVSRRRNHEHHF